MQKEFYANYPQHAKEEEYKFVAPSSLKPTQACTQACMRPPPPPPPPPSLPSGIISDHGHRAGRACWELVMQRGDAGCFNQ
jgi:hypothetical protein